MKNNVSCHLRNFSTSCICKTQSIDHRKIKFHSFTFCEKILRWKPIHENYATRETLTNLLIDLLRYILIETQQPKAENKLVLELETDIVTKKKWHHADREKKSCKALTMTTWSKRTPSRHPYADCSPEHSPYNFGLKGIKNLYFYPQTLMCSPNVSQTLLLRMFPCCTLLHWS